MLVEHNDTALHFPGLLGDGYHCIAKHYMIYFFSNFIMQARYSLDFGNFWLAFSAAGLHRTQSSQPACLSSPLCLPNTPKT